ncbi:MAG: hypothetical protein IKM33_05350 [Clostridia bacterium]|nr:hypothetical protein [Clostridia bacterium]
MLELKECCQVPFPEKLFEGYEVTDSAIYANVNASKVPEMMRQFIAMHEEPLFFLLEIPRKGEEGIAAEKTSVHDEEDLYFVDGLNGEQATGWIDSLGNFLVRDGMNTFGIGCHESHEEILFSKYNVLTIYTQNSEAYRPFLSSFGIAQVETLLTAWNTFDDEHPGECRLYVSKETGKTIYDIPEAYKAYGMYLYKPPKDDTGGEEEITPDDLLGKVLLVGITYYTQSDEFIEQKQFYGTVTEVGSTLIRLRQKDGTEITLPPDLRSTKRARPGEYTLRSTGEVVVNPDFLATWNVNRA